ncbi:hypothetical protein ABZV24_13065 [Streptomyces sp. NPDC005251]|uniref:hypothetical protein n=1 Tax=Streptomyces sp. NPDC005251 TaxID=3157166 RepID=UPI0033B24422
MLGFSGTSACEECSEWLTGRQRRYCSDQCKMRAHRREKGPRPAEKVCRLCGATFQPLRGKQTFCDYDNDANVTCAAMQSELGELAREAQDQRYDAECAREGCEDNTGWDGIGRPRRFCSARCKVAHYRTEKRPAAR